MYDSGETLTPEQMKRITGPLLAVHAFLQDSKDNPLIRPDDAAKIDQIFFHCIAAPKALGAFPDDEDEDEDVTPMMPG